MGKHSVAKNPRLWPEFVLMWCEKLEMPNNHPMMRRWLKQSRVQSEIETHVAIANSLLTESAAPSATESARRVLMYFYCATRLNQPINPAVDEFIRNAGKRYRTDPRKNIRKALLLERSKRGNPGPVVSKKRRLTPEGKIEAVEMFIELRSRGLLEKQATQIVADYWRVSPRTIRSAVAAYRKTETDIAAVMENPE